MRNTPTCTRAYCQGCKTDFEDVDDLLDHECGDADPEFVKQRGLDGTLGSGQVTLDGGIRPSNRDRGMVVWRSIALSVFMMAVVLFAAIVFTMLTGGWV